MRTIKIKIIKKNRKYFACTKNGYKAKLLIDENSENLEPGEVELLVNDISVRSSYGTDLIYQVAGKQDPKSSGICTLKHDKYNLKLVSKCKELGGRFDRENMAWVFRDIVEDKVEELDYVWNSKPIKIEITAKKRVTAEVCPRDFYGYTLFRATSRDSGSELGDGISMMEGAIDSGGSLKNWVSVCEKGTVFRLSFPENLMNELEEEEGSVFDIKRLDEEKGS